MKQTHLEQGSRFEQLIKHLGFNQTSFADAFEDHQSNISKMVRGERAIPPKLLLAMSRRHNVNTDWIETGEGEMFLDENWLAKEPDIKYEGEPSAAAVQKVYDAVMDKYKPKGLTGTQDVTLRQACLRVLKENPGVPLVSLVVGAGVYLRFIQADPNFIIPSDYSPPGGGGG